MITSLPFYAVAVPAVLLIGMSKSGFGSGFGSLAVPMMALTVTVPQAAAILMPLLLVMDILAIRATWRNADWQLLKFLIPFALLGCLIGAILFSLLNARLVAGIVGSLTLIFLFHRVWKNIYQPSQVLKALPTFWGAILTATSGFTSFIAHAGGPPINAYTLTLQLRPQVFTATLAILFCCMNLSKWLPYGLLGLLSFENISTSLVLLPLAPIGVWIGVRLSYLIQPTLFYQLIHLGMLLTGIKLVWDGFIA